MNVQLFLRIRDAKHLGKPIQDCLIVPLLHELEHKISNKLLRFFIWRLALHFEEVVLHKEHQTEHVHCLLAALGDV